MALRQLASKYDVERVPPNAGRKRLPIPGATISMLTPAATDGGGRGSSLVMIVTRPCLFGVLRSFLFGSA